MADPQPSDADDEGLSRFLDDDLDVDEAAALRTRLEAEPVLRERLAGLGRVQDLLRVVPTPTAEAMDGLLRRALEAFDERGGGADRADATDPGATDPRGPDAAVGAQVVPLEAAPSRRGARGVRRNLLGLSAAAALVLVVGFAAVAARLGGGTSDAGGDAAATAELSFDEQRATAKEGVSEALSAQVAPSAESDASTAADGSGSPGTAAGTAGAAGASPTTIAARPDDNTLPSATVDAPPFETTAALIDAVRLGSLQPSVSGAPPADCLPQGADLLEVAIVDGRRVRWGVRTDTAGSRIVVLDATTCTVLAEQPS